MVSNIVYFHPYLGKITILTNIFQRGWNHQLDMAMLGKHLSYVFLALFLAAWKPLRSSRIHGRWPNTTLQRIVGWFCMAASMIWPNLLGDLGEGVGQVGVLFDNNQSLGCFVGHGKGGWIGGRKEHYAKLHEQIWSKICNRQVCDCDLYGILKWPFYRLPVTSNDRG